MPICRGDGRRPMPSNAGSAAARSSTTHPNSSSRSWFPTARTAIRTTPRTAAEHTMFTVAVGAAVQAPPGRAGRPRRRQLLDRFDDLRRRPGARRARAARRLGAVGRHRDRLPGRAVRSPRASVDRRAFWSAGEALHDSTIEALVELGRARSRAGHAAARGAGVRTRPRRTPACANACRAMSPPRRWCSTTPEHRRCSRCTRGSAAGFNSGVTARTDDPDIVAAALREATEESGIADLTIDPAIAAIHVHPVTCSLGVPTRHLDLQFIVHAPAGAEIVCSDESLDLRWWPLDGLPATTPHDWRWRTLRPIPRRDRIPRR